MHFGILGAGSIGCYVGGMLAAGGEKVTMVRRPAMANRLAAGMDMTRYDGLARELDPNSIDFSTSARALARCDTILVCVKSGDTEEAGRTLLEAGVEGATIVSLQNGISNADQLRVLAPECTVLAAMVPFNVARIGESRFHRGTEGTLVIEGDGPDAETSGEIARRLSQAHIAAATASDIKSVLWGKLAMNLNNAVNVLSGLPLKAQLSQRAYRLVLAASVREALAAMQAGGINPAKIGKVRPQIIPAVVSLPDWLFRLVAANMLKIDEEARSSMAEDLDAGRKPEIDWLNGEIVRLGLRTGIATPVNAKLSQMVNRAFAEGKSPNLSGAELLRKVGL